MELRLIRQPSADGLTHGDLFINDKWVSYTLEDGVHVRPMVAHEAAIPPGRYRVLVNRSPRSQRMLPLLTNVPGLDEVRIHAGPFTEDTADGILVGLQRFPTTLGSARQALELVLSAVASALARHEDVFLTIEATVQV